MWEYTGIKRRRKKRKKKKKKEKKGGGQHPVCRSVSNSLSAYNSSPHVHAVLTGCLWPVLEVTERSSGGSSLQVRATRLELGQNEILKDLQFIGFVQGNPEDSVRSVVCLFVQGHPEDSGRSVVCWFRARTPCN